MTTIGIVLGSTRPRRRGAAVAEWVASRARQRADAHQVEYVVLDLADFALPVLDEPLPAKWGSYAHEHTRRWAEAIAACDGFVFVTPEYNRAEPGVLKNAIDFLFAEWNHKAAGFVTYGVQGGHRAAESLRLVLAELHVATVRQQVAASLITDFEITDPAEPGTFTPGAHHAKDLDLLLDEVVAWAQALAPLRAGTGVEVGTPA
jgi:NAD(P)H-dependent FMN reductase